MEITISVHLPVSRAQGFDLLLLGAVERAKAPLRENGGTPDAVDNYGFLWIAYELSRIRERILQARVNCLGKGVGKDIDLDIPLGEFLAMFKAYEDDLFPDTPYELSLIHDLLINQGLAQVNRFINLNL